MISDNLVLAAETVGVSDPTLALGLNGVTDWSPQQAFIDQMKTARPWTASPAWDASGTPLGYEDLSAGGYLDADGWPTEIPAGLDNIWTFFAWGDFQASDSFAGTYVLSYEGAGELELAGEAQSITILSEEPGRIVFQSTGENIALRIRETDPDGTGDYIRDISIVREEHVDLYEAGAVFNPEWTSLVEDARQFRFMDWMRTNNSTLSEWDDRSQPDDFTYALDSGVPVEIMVQLANELGVDPWFTMPLHATDEYIREFATYVRDNLDPRLKASVELSNETWNGAFQQTQDLAAASNADWGDDPWGGYYVKEATNMALIWDEVYGAEADARLVKVLAGFLTVPWLTEQQITAAEWFAYEPDQAIAPSEVFDAFAVTTYFGSSTIGDEALRDELIAAINDPGTDAMA